MGIAIEWEVVEILQGFFAPRGGDNLLSDITPEDLGYLHVQEVWYVKGDRRREEPSIYFRSRGTLDQPFDCG